MTEDRISLHPLLLWWDAYKVRKVVQLKCWRELPYGHFRQPSPQWFKELCVCCNQNEHCFCLSNLQRVCDWFSWHTPASVTLHASSSVTETPGDSCQLHTWPSSPRVFESRQYSEYRLIILCMWHTSILFYFVVNSRWKHLNFIC